ncbi:MAG TPA: MFS transporter [Candidatus Methylomirabilis sp.]|nr:MFS transporter [Candidatus Methylomirabilis sp.]
MIFRALRSRNYRLFFGGQSVSLIGTWMQQIAVSWLVYRMTNSAFMLGVVGFAGQIPTSLLAPVAGVCADRLNRHRILIVTQTLAMIQALMLALLVLTRTVTVWQIITLSVFLGLVNAFDMPVRQAFIVDMIERREDLGNAIALNSTIFNGARLLGPSIAGLLIASLGEGLCFLLNGISYVAVIGALSAMRMAPRTRAVRRTDMVQELREAFSYAFGFAPIRSILLLLGLVSLIGMPYTTLMPVFAKDVFHGGAHTLGFLVGASGVGALVGTMYLASRASVRGLGRLIAISASIFGVGLIAFSLSRVLWFSLLLMLLTGFGMVVHFASGNTVLQTIVDDDKRGRVMSLFTMAVMGAAPFGSLLAGALASQIGAPATLLLCGICCVSGSLLFTRVFPSLRGMIRPIYVRKGIIPEVVSGVETAANLSGPPAD